NIRQDLPPSWVIYAPVMSQLTRTVSRSWGLTEGWNMAPPPPGPIILKLPGRGASPSPLARRRNPKNALRKQSIHPLLCLLFLALSFLAESPCIVNPFPLFSSRELP